MERTRENLSLSGGNDGPVFQSGKDVDRGGNLFD
jgi:hypothetical protein